MRKLSLSHVALGLALIAPVAAHAQSHSYLLNNSFADQFSGPSLVGNAAGLSSSGYRFSARNGGLSLSNVLTSPVYTILFRTRLVTPTGPAPTTPGYQKLVDFQNETSDNGYYNNATTAEFYNGLAQSSVLGSYGVTPHASRVTILTRDYSGVFSVFVNGVLQLSFTDTAGDAIFSSTGNIAQFFTDDVITGGSEDPTGLVNYIAIWDDYALTAQQATNWESSSITATPEPATITLLATGLLGVFAAARRRRKVA